MKEQRSCIPRTLFIRSIRVPYGERRDWRIRQSAWKAIQQISEQHIAHLFRSSADFAHQDGRVTVQLSDFEDALKAST